MAFDAKPDGDDMRQFVCSGVNFDIEEKPVQKKRRMKSEGVEPRLGLGSLRARADSKTIVKKLDNIIIEKLNRPQIDRR